MATARLAPRLDLKELWPRLPPRFQGKRSPSWIGLRVGPNATYVAIYPSGTALVTGVDSVSRARDVIAILRDELANLLPVLEGTLQVDVKNLVGVADLHGEINLDAVARGSDPGTAEYEPEQFPALVLRAGTSGRCLVFSAGKVVLTGARSQAGLEEQFRELLLALERFR